MVKKKTSIITKLVLTTALFSTAMLPLYHNPVSAQEGVFTTQATKTDKSGLQYYVDSDNTVTITGYSKKSQGAKVTIPAKIDGKVVSKIGDYAFEKKLISSVVIPEGVTHIGDHAFMGNSLSEVSFPKSLTEIGKNAFRANVIKKVKFSEGLKTIGDNAFQANLISEFTLPKSLTNIGKGIFNYNIGSETSDTDSSVDAPVEETLPNLSNIEKVTVNVTNESGIKETSTLPTKTEVAVGENENSMNLGLQGGELSMTVPETVALNVGKVKVGKEPTKTTIKFNNNITVSDLRATGEGWHLTVQAEPFTQVKAEGGIPPKGGWYKFPTGSIMLGGKLEIKPVDATNQSPAPVSTVSNKQGGVAIDGGAVTVASAYYNEGMGDWRLTFPNDAITLTISSQYAKSDKLNYPDGPTPYESKITWTLVSGPGA